MKERDYKTKKEFIKYLKRTPSQRFFQAVCNFTKEYLDANFDTISATSVSETEKGTRIKNEDTFYWECDEKFHA